MHAAAAAGLFAEAPGSHIKQWLAARVAPLFENSGLRVFGGAWGGGNTIRFPKTQSCVRGIRRGAHIQLKILTSLSAERGWSCT